MTTARKKQLRSVHREADARRAKSSPFANRLLAEWRRLGLPQGDARIVVAVSGGADSVALMSALDELLRARRLGVSPVIAHLDHALRASSGEDARWVAGLACDLGHEVEVERAEVHEQAEKAGDNLEQAARRARYEFLARVAAKQDARVVLTAHTMDDQAETVILRLLRGSGAEGLGGIKPVRLLAADADVLLVRPLLNWARRADTEEYCRARGVCWRSDEMNLDERFARVRVRKSLIPLMQSFNARAVETLARTARILREDAAALDTVAGLLLEESRVAKAGALDVHESDSYGPSELCVDVLARAPKGLRRRALRRWIAEARGDLRRLEMVHFLAVERLLLGERGGRVVELPGGATVLRRKGRLIFQLKKVEKGDADR